MKFQLIIALTMATLFWWGCSHKPVINSTAERSLAGQTLDTSGYLYDPKDISCGGFPRINVGTMSGSCLGLVIPKSKSVDPVSKLGFVKPRTILQVPGTKSFLLVDMGGWASNNGRLFLLSPGTSGYTVKLIRKGLDLPHGFRVGPDGMFYLAEKAQVSRFNFANGAIINWQLVVGGLTKKEGYMHPLSQIVFDPRSGDLFLNSGSMSDHCSLSGKTNFKYCDEDEKLGSGQILRIPAFMLKNIPAGGVKFFEISAEGLRNSMAMVVHSSGMLIQGENSRDFSELEEPYEEINTMDLNDIRGNHYGWPYCYNFHATSPEWAFPENKNLPTHKQFRKPVDCMSEGGIEAGDYKPPYALVPPHAAPLHMDYYQGNMFPTLKNKLIMAWHGYQPTGQRIVAYNIDDRGRPLLNPEGSFGFNQKGGCAVKRKFRPHGGVEAVAPYQEVIGGWNDIKGVRPKGAPVAFTTADDGSIWIVDDKNLTVVRLSADSTKRQDPCEGDAAVDTPLSSDPKIEFLAWRHFVKSNPTVERLYTNVQTNLVNKNCLGCHGDMYADDIAKDRFSRLDHFVKFGWLNPGDKSDSKLYGSVAHLERFTPMPPMDKVQFYGKPEGTALINTVGEFISSLTPEIEKTYTRIVMGSARNIRTVSNSTGVACGQLQEKDVVYVDPRSEHRPKNEGFIWTKVYLVPGHSRLLPGKCAYPEDGVYWIALIKG